MANQHNFSPEKYQSIQMMRGIACLLVIAFHASLQLKKYHSVNWTNSLLSEGYAGVDLFFVISGFVIAHSSDKLVGNANKVGTYFTKRFVRIYPLYWIILLPSIIGLLLTAPDKIPVGNPITVLSHWLTIVLLIPDHEAVNAVSWSLSHELYFYTLFSLTIISPRFWIALVAILMVTLAGIFGLSIPTNLLFYFSPFNLEFCAGIVVWHISTKLKPSISLSVISTLTGILIIGYFHEIPSNENHLIRVLIFGSASSFFLFGLLKVNEIVRLTKMHFYALLAMPPMHFTCFIFHT